MTVTPESIADSADILREAGRDGATVRFVGSRSRAELGGIGVGDIELSSAGLDGVIDWLVDDMTVVVGAGTPVAALESMLSEAGQTSLLPDGEPDRTVGGIVAEGASGFRRLRYGPTRDRVLEVTVATGYGKVIRGGGRLVKNVTGYDVPRLMTGSLGSLGFIGAVCLKLWPLPPVRRTVAVPDPDHSLATLFRPGAVLETDRGSMVLLEGSESDVVTQVSLVGGGDDVEEPAAIDDPVLVSVRVPPRHLSGVLGRIAELRPRRFVAQHGVGLVDIGWEAVESAAVVDLRTEVERLGGAVVVVRGGIDVEPWGAPPSTLAIQHRMKDLFDPHRVCNPGILPGGL